MAKLLICANCGRAFDEPRLVYESRGEFWGAPAYEPMSYSPCCNDDYEEYDSEYKGFEIEPMEDGKFYAQLGDTKETEIICDTINELQDAIDNFIESLE